VLGAGGRGVSGVRGCRQLASMWAGCVASCSLVSIARAQRSKSSWLAGETVVIYATFRKVTNPLTISTHQRTANTQKLNRTAVFGTPRSMIWLEQYLVNRITSCRHLHFQNDVLIVTSKNYVRKSLTQPHREMQVQTIP
jgi:hypothetical protein